MNLETKKYMIISLDVEKAFGKNQTLLYNIIQGEIWETRDIHIHKRCRL